MSQSNSTSKMADQISQQELQHLITVSTGFIDAYIIDCHGKDPMLLPQNIVLSALDSNTQVKTVEWHEAQLPAIPAWLKFAGRHATVVWQVWLPNRRPLTQKSPVFSWASALYAKRLRIAASSWRL